MVLVALGCGGATRLDEWRDAGAIDASNTPSDAADARRVVPDGPPAERAADVTPYDSFIEEGVDGEMSDSSCGDAARDAYPASTPCGLCDAPRICGRPCRTCMTLRECCTPAPECCAADTDCCSGRCNQGICQTCKSDPDCADSAYCIEGTCVRPPGAPCTQNSQCASDDCRPDGCFCAWPPGGKYCRTNAECCVGACVSNRCEYVPHGGMCQRDDDCSGELCKDGICACLPAGVPAVGDPFGSCCSRQGSLGSCVAVAGEACTNLEPDCYGGSCIHVGSPLQPSSNPWKCECVGPGGICKIDGDCCAGATLCVNNTCR
jgi:hypothetical protein